MKFKALITDVDNTLFDWIEIWHSSFTSMINRVSEIADLHPEDLYPEIKRIHQSHGTSEYAYLLEEMPTLKTLDDATRLRAIIEGNKEFANARREATSLYAHVYETLSELKSAGTRIIAFTESYGVYTAYRFRACNLDGLIEVLYSPEKHHVSKTEFAQYSHSHDEHHVLDRTEMRHTPSGETKPNPKILQSIVSDFGLNVADCIYVGDSRMKDIAMAQDLGMADALAGYGHAQHRAEYDLLKKVTHWPDEVVRKESETNNNNLVLPTYELNNSFGDLLGIVR